MKVFFRMDEAWRDFEITKHELCADKIVELTEEELKEFEVKK